MWSRSSSSRSRVSSSNVAMLKRQRLSPAGMVTRQGPAAKSSPLFAPPRSSASTFTVTSSARQCESSSSGRRAPPSFTRYVPEANDTDDVAGGCASLAAMVSTCVPGLVTW